MMSKIGLWLQEVRAPFFTAVIVPALLGAAVAANHQTAMNWFYFSITLFGLVCIHAGANVANDYFDHKSRSDDLNEEYVRPFTGGSRMIQDGLLTPREVMVGAIVLLFIGCLIGGYLTLIKGPFILYLGIFGVFTGFFYSSPPFHFVNRGLGELVIGLDFGILATLGAYYVQTGQVHIEPVIAAIPVAILIAMVVFINEFQDYHADKKVGKNQWVVRLGRPKAAQFYTRLMILLYAIIILSALTRLTSIYTLVSLVTLPWGLKASKIARTYFDDPVKLTPANASTIGLHLMVGLLICLGYVIDYWI
ncbi:1,4-dihydroxy-2-naphthoate octaprenyltransferase [candidate division KSB1 bacterium]|nr:1,4-dihydroxy-2-naphthoate octaprenyltransferase [candidate division KSB1 bacterium]